MKLLVAMKCGHIRAIGERVSPARVLCHECGMPGNKAVDIVTVEWRAACSTCTYARWCGMSQIMASETANTHARKCPGHRVRVAKVVNQRALIVKVRLIRNGILTP